jgi:hypothetical protein
MINKNITFKFKDFLFISIFLYIFGLSWALFIISLIVIKNPIQILLSLNISLFSLIMFYLFVQEMEITR